MLFEAATQTQAIQKIWPYLAHNTDITSSGSIGERWYVVHTQPHAEKRAICHLERQGFFIFCPRMHKTVRHARKTTRVLAPMFPNYLFVRLDVSRIDGEA